MCYVRVINKEISIHYEKQGCNLGVYWLKINNDILVIMNSADTCMWLLQSVQACICVNTVSSE